MHPQLDLDFVQIDWYTALVALAILLGLAAAFIYLRWRTRPVFPVTIFFDGALLVLAAAWLGARGYHVLAHWDYYATRPGEILSFGAGGLGIRGAIVLGFVALALYARWRRLRWARLLDASALGLALGQAVGWVAALVEGANYGIVSESRIAQDLPDIYGLIDPRFPLQHIEIIFFALLFIFLAAIAGRRPRSGFVFLVYLLLSSLANGLLGFGRADETAYLGTLRIDQIFDTALALLALVGLAVFQWRKPPVSARVMSSFNTIEKSSVATDQAG